MRDLDSWRTSVLGIAAVGQTCFILLYATFPWWRSFLGRVLFVKSLTIGLLLISAELGQFWNWAYEEWTIVLVGAAVAVGIWGQVVAFICVMLTHRRSEWEVKE